MLSFPEPETVAPESAFEATIVEVIRGLLAEAGCAHLLVPKFGLDVGLFLTGSAGAYARFLEVKVYAGGRPGAVGFGNGKGEGPQVELLLCAEGDMHLLDQAVGWVLADSTRPLGSARYALFDCRTACKAAMGQISKGKQNNLRIAALQGSFVTWSKLVELLRQFLLGQATASD
jgi:hypothetical protein